MTIYVDFGDAVFGRDGLGRDGFGLPGVPGGSAVLAPVACGHGVLRASHLRRLHRARRRWAAHGFGL